MRPYVAAKTAEYRRAVATSHLQAMVNRFGQPIEDVAMRAIVQGTKHVARIWQSYPATVHVLTLGIPMLSNIVWTGSYVGLGFTWDPTWDILLFTLDAIAALFGCLLLLHVDTPQATQHGASSLSGRTLKTICLSLAVIAVVHAVLLALFTVLFFLSLSVKAMKPISDELLLEMLAFDGIIYLRGNLQGLLGYCLMRTAGRLE
jgi:hypothetical protein